MDSKNLEMFMDYSELMDISLDLTLKVKRLQEENMHYKRIIESLLAEKLSSNEQKKYIKKLFKNKRDKEIGNIPLEECILG